MSMCKRRWGRSIAVLAVTLLAGQSLASGSTVELETAEEWVPQDRVIVAGLGAAAVPDYEGSNDFKAAPVPLFRLLNPSGWYMELIGNTLRANLMPNHRWRAGPQLRHRAERDDVDNDKVDAMEKVDAAIEAGGFLGFAYEGWHVRVDAAADVTDAHDGYLVGLNGGYTLTTAPWRVTASAFTTYADENYMSTYFGVDAADAVRSGLQPFDADSGFKDLGATLVCSYRFNARWRATGAARYSRLLGDAADSPLVDDEGSDNQFLLAALVSYAF